MSGQQIKAKSTFIPPPIDGLNLISPPNQLSDTQARTLNDYYVYDWGVRQRGILVTGYTASGTNKIYAMMPFLNLDLNENVLVIITGGIYVLTSVGGTPTLVSATSSNSRTTLAAFKSCIFAFGYLVAANTHYRYNIGAGTVTTTPYTFTGTSSAVPVQGDSYKERMYITLANTPLLAGFGNIMKYAYSDVSAISGACTVVDLSTVFKRVGGGLLFVASWTYNQGLSNDPLFVACSSVGEVLVYSGDFPGAANWQLIGQVDIPTPKSNTAWCRLGSDFIINTTRGAINLGEVLRAGNKGDAAYYATSRNIGNVQLRGNITQDGDDPFLYFPVIDEKVIYVLNFERGAWSKFNFPQITNAVTASCFAFGTLMISDAVEAIGAGSKIYYLSDASVDTAATYTLSTKYFDYGSNTQKSQKLIRVLTRATPLGGTLTNATELSVSIAHDYTEADIGPASFDTRTALSSQETKVVELTPAGTGYALSYVFSKQPAGATAITEILGFQSYIEDNGGVY